MSISVRSAVNGDYDQLRQLVKEIQLLHARNRPDIYNTDCDPMPRARYAELQNSAGMNVFVCEDTEKGAIAAYCVARRADTSNIPLLKPRKSVYIEEFCVRCDYRHRGVGRLLFEHVAGFSKAEGASSIELIVWEFNRDALAFYRAMGMKEKNIRLELRI